ncbi:MAG: DegT/DnrJ/EryC1/StrS aminotransferase family protein [Bacteroidales bacterium]|nr:DegT/DnrJ/EryC1/StrS aminotransferase family protein [Bacteroidales bacterium]MBN2757704.1 DegT/DnrJ/EryC1/StrS aminotransferase family protein [Bacteroidales bacterium]
MNIRLFKPSIGQEELDNIKQVFDREWLGLGPMVSQFEKEWNDYVGTKMSIGLNSATAALHLALMAYKFPKGKKVLVPAITFASTATAVLYNDLIPVFVDVEKDTASMDLEDLKRKYTDDCVAVIPVHNGGYPVPMDKLMEIAKELNLKVIEDCAHSAGGVYKGKKLGTWGDIGCFSFEEKKCMTTGDGGMICSNDIELIEPLKAQRWVGIDKDTWKRTQSADTENDAMHWHYEIALLGYKYNMNDIAAAIGLAQLHKLEQMNLKRRNIIKKYLNGIENLKTIKPIFPYDTEKGAYWFFGIRSEHRDELIIYLKNLGIATGVHFYPLPLQPLFAPYNNGCKVAEEIWKTFITLPSHIDLTDEELDFVIKAIQEFDAKK